MNGFIGFFVKTEKNNNQSTDVLMETNPNTFCVQ